MKNCFLYQVWDLLNKVQEMKRNILNQRKKGRDGLFILCIHKKRDIEMREKKIIRDGWKSKFLT